MHFTPSRLVLTLAAIAQAALVSANHYQPRMNEDLSARGSSPFAAHVRRARDPIHHRGSLRKRCARTSGSQITLTGDSSDDSDNQAASSTGNDNNDNGAASNTTIAATKATASNTTSHTGSWLKKNCVTWGWITDDGDHSHGSTGSLETPAQINSAVGTDAQYFGAYAHIQGDEYKKGAFTSLVRLLLPYTDCSALYQFSSRAGDKSTYFDGSEVIPYVDYLKGTGAIAVLSIMPVYGWGGLTSDDDTQALQTVKVLQQFVDAGIEVYLRFGHEMVSCLYCTCVQNDQPQF